MLQDYALPPSAHLSALLVCTDANQSFLDGCLSMLIEQTYYASGAMEIILIDATSGSDHTVLSATERIPGLIALSVRPGTPTYAALNEGLRLAQGTYVTHVTLSDRYRQDALEHLVDALDTHPGLGVAYADQLVTTTPNETMETTTTQYRWNWPSYEYSLLETCNVIGTQAVWHRWLHDVYGYFRGDMHHAGDYELWLRIGSHEEFLRLPEILGINYVNPDEQDFEAHDQEIDRVRKAYLLPDLTPSERNILPVAMTDGDQITPTPASIPDVPAEAPSAPEVDQAILGLSEAFQELLTRHMWPDAIELMAEGVRNLPNEPYLWVLLAVAFRLNQQPVEAVEAIKQSLLIEETPEALFEMVQLSVETGNTEEAHEAATYLKQTFPEWTAQALTQLDEISSDTPLIAKSA